MSLLIRKYKSVGGMMQEERIDDPDRIERYMRLFERTILRNLRQASRFSSRKMSGNSFRRLYRTSHAAATSSCPLDS